MTTKLKQASIAIRQNAKRDMSPKWDNCDQWTASQFLRHFHHAMQYYRMESNGKELKSKVIEWMNRNGYDNDVIRSYKKTKDSRTGVTAGAIAACLLRGMPPCRADFNHGKDTTLWLGAEISAIINQGRYDIEETVTASESTVTLSIQERTRDTAFAMTEEIEKAFDVFAADPENFNPKAFKVLSLLKSQQAKAGHARIIRDFYANALAELDEAASSDPDNQIKEGYSHLTKKQMKLFLQFLKEIETACTMLMEEAKVNRAPPKLKEISKDKLVSKIKYKKTDDQLKLVSVNPINIIGSKELWIFDTKTRKLGKYVAAEFNDLAVKGTTIVGFDSTKSIQKTLRKPAEQLLAFKSAGKIALRKFLDEINAVDIKLSGRLNEHQILLKIQ